MAFNSKSFLLSSVLMLGALQTSAQTVKQGKVDTIPLKGHQTGKIYQVDNPILMSFGEDGYDPLVQEVDKPTDIEPDSTTHNVLHSEKIQGHGEVRRFDVRSISSQDDHLASDEVISERVVYLNKEGDLVLVVEMPTSAWGR